MAGKGRGGEGRCWKGAIEGKVVMSIDDASRVWKTKGEGDEGWDA